MLAAVPYILYKIYPPEIKHTPEAVDMARNELAAMGPMSRQELYVAGVFVGCVLLWSTSKLHGLHATAVALTGLIAMLWTRALDWNDLLEEKGAWDTMIWMGCLICLAGFMAKFGLLSWFAKTVSAPIAGISWHYAILALIIIYMYSHYFFASGTAHVVAMFSAFVAVAVASGAPTFMAVFPFLGMTGIYGTLTYYGTGPGPILFGSRYIEQSEWFRLGFIISTFNLVVWIVVGSIWWKVLGYW